jgi:hypothetical protein
MGTFLLRRPIPNLLCAPYRSTVARIGPGSNGSLRKLTMLCALSGACILSTGVFAEGVEVSGQMRGAWVQRQIADTGPLADANRLQSGTVAIEPSAGTVQAEVRASGSLAGVTLNAVATLQTRSPEGGRIDSDGWINEAYASGKALGWQWSAGKKAVSWDVGYAFRPNDVVQQEVRRG